MLRADRQLLRLVGPRRIALQDVRHAMGIQQLLRPFPAVGHFHVWIFGIGGINEVRRLFEHFRVTGHGPSCGWHDIGCRVEKC
jgi:hypothetical protein